MPKILIVDDEWLTRLEIEGMLTDLGYDVAGQAETGAEAIAMARELNPDLVLMDVKMPGEMNGIDAAREIKAELGIAKLLTKFELQPQEKRQSGGGFDGHECFSKN